jgi:two-component system, OmpR family, response regulator
VKATVLIVDDSTFIVEGLVAILRKSFRALPSFGGEECLAILRTEKPDIIVLDIMMEPMDGWETLSRIKENPATRHIPVLMFSAKKISPEEAEAHRIRIDDFLTKPVNPRDLVTAIEKILEREKQNKAILSVWSKAGIPRETIDEYLTWSSNLEVDLSLLAAMNKQLGHPTTSPVRRQDLEITIAMLGERIEKGRDAIKNFFESTGLSLPSADEIAEVNLPVPEIVPAADITIPVAGPAVPPSEAIPAGPSGGVTTVVTEPVTLPADEPPAVSGPPARETKAVPDQQPVQTDAPEAGEVSLRSEAPVMPSEPAGEVPAAPAGAAIAGTVEIPAEAAMGNTGRVEWIPIPSHADPFSKGNAPDIDHLFGHEPVQAAPGSGNPAHIPLPSITHSIRHDGDSAGKHGQDPGHPAGFFSRIIAMITGLFRRH